MHAFIYLSSLVTLFRTFSTILNKSGKSGHDFVIADLKGKIFSLSSLSMVAEGFFIDSIYQVDDGPSFLCSVENYYQ